MLSQCLFDFRLNTWQSLPYDHGMIGQALNWGSFTFIVGDVYLSTSGIKTTWNAHLPIFIKILFNIYPFRASEHPLNTENVQNNVWEKMEMTSLNNSTYFAWFSLLPCWVHSCRLELKRFSLPVFRPVRVFKRRLSFVHLSVIFGCLPGRDHTHSSLGKAHEPLETQGDNCSLSPAVNTNCSTLWGSTLELLRIGSLKFSTRKLRWHESIYMRVC